MSEFTFRSLDLLDSPDSFWGDLAVSSDGKGSLSCVIVPVRGDVISKGYCRLGG